MQQKRPHTRTPVIAAVLMLALTCALGATPCLALTGKDVTDKMSADQRSGYLAGLIDMRALQASVDGNEALAKCIIDRFYRTEGRDDPLPGVIDALHQFPDKQTATIVFLLIKKACGG